MRFTEQFSTRVRWAVVLGLPLWAWAVLWLDARATVGQQHALAVPTLLLLLACLRGLTGFERRVVYACIGVSTCIELFATQVWGVYHYRLGNLPLFVPIGHGLICAHGMLCARLPWSPEGRRRFVLVALAIAVGWGALGLTRLDVLGALFLPWFAWLLLRTERAADYAATFLVASCVELLGANFGNWRWSEALPLFEIPSANPPSVAAGGYCWFAYLGWLGVRAWSAPAQLSQPSGGLRSGTD